MPYAIARYITERRGDDLKAVRKCQNLEAAVRKADPLALEDALKHIEKERSQHAAHSPTVA